MTSHSEALEVTIASDPVLSKDEHFAEVTLARAVAAELDKQIENGEMQTRTLATFAGVLGALRRIIRDEQTRRLKSQTKQLGTASRLALIRAQAAKARTATDDTEEEAH